MFRKYLCILMAVLAIFSLTLSACGNDASETEPTGVPSSAGSGELGLANWELTASTWSSPNGATVHISATPLSYEEGQNALFLARLEGDVAAQAVCDWDGTAYTASLDLNGADGYCYYVILTSSQGEQTEVPVNTPTDPYDQTLINLSSSLNSFCDVTVTNSEFDGSTLKITESTVRIQAPLITDDGQPILCTEAYFLLTRNGEEIDRADLMVAEMSDDGSYSFTSQASFSVPAMEDDQQLTAELYAVLSNGQTLTAPAGTWIYHDGDLLMGVG